MDNRRNFYRILHVQRDAPLEIIKTSYRTLMQRMKMHPDLGGDIDDAQLINLAYATLSDPARRVDYDAGLAASVDALRETAQDEQPAAAADTAPASAAPPKSRPHEADAKPRCTFCDAPVPPGGAREGLSCAACDSPLRPVMATAGQAAGRYSERAMERVPRRLPALIQLRPGNSDAYQAQVIDVSPSGMRVSASVIVPIGATIRVQCGICRGVGRVRSCRRDFADAAHERQIGIEFTTLEFRAKTGSFVSVEA